MESSYHELENEEHMLRNVSRSPPSGIYKDFETIDWLKDLNRDRARSKDIKRRSRSLWVDLYSLFDSGSGWICVFFVGVFTGITAAIIDISSEWMFDLKVGICKDTFWLSKEQCCWISNSSSLEDEHCNEWYPWSRLLLGASNAPNHYIVDYGFFILFALLFAWFAVRFVITFAPYACGSGIPEIKTILSGFVIRGYLGKWTLLIKSLGMILAVSAGLCLGKEGPMVHMAVCWGNLFSYLFPKYKNNGAKKREIMSAAAAAGVAVAFGSPVGGVLFSLEEASYYFPLKTMFRSFFCAMVAANVVRILNPFGNENLTMFNLDYKAQWHAIELIPFAFLGVLGGIFGIIFNKGNIWVCSMRKKSKLGKFPCVEVLIVTFITASISFPQLYMRINSNELIRIMVGLCGKGDNVALCDYKVDLENGNKNIFGNYEASASLYTAMGMLALALICKIVLSTYSFGIKVPCGLFIPSLTIGAMIGRMLGIGIEQLAVRYKDIHWIKDMCKSNEACINPGLYAVVGAVACLGGVTRITVSLVVIMLEVTGGSNYILPFMIATMFSKWTGDRLTHTIYDEHIMLNNYPFLTIENQFLIDAKAADIMSSNDQPLEVITKDSMTLGDIQKLINNSTVYGFPVVESHESPYLLGMVAKCDIEWAIKGFLESDLLSKVCFSNTVWETSFKKSINLSSILDKCPITVSHQTEIETIFDFFIKLGIRQILVTEKGLLRGIITKKDVIMFIKKYHQ